MTHNNHSRGEQDARKIANVREDAGMREEHNSPKTNAKNDSAYKPIHAESNPDSFGERSIKERTKDNYYGYFQAMCNYSEGKSKLQGLDEDLTPMRVAKDMFERVDIEGESKKSYAAALIYMYKKDLDKDDFCDAINYVFKQIDLLKENKSKKPRKRNYIPEKNFKKILSFLELWDSESKWALPCLIAVYATVSAGLRPSEWDSAKWINREKGELFCKNAKVKNSSPAFYEMTQDEWDAKKLTERIVYVRSEIDRYYVDAQIRSLEEFKRRTGKGAPEFNNALRDALRSVCLKIWGKSKYTFYDMRGQFAANARWIYGPEKAAEMMGHSGPDTPSRGRYGGANQAFPSVKKEINRHKANDRYQVRESPSRPRDIG